MLKSGIPILSLVWGGMEVLQRQNPCSQLLRRETFMRSSQRLLEKPSACVPRRCRSQSKVQPLTG